MHGHEKWGKAMLKVRGKLPSPFPRGSAVYAPSLTLTLTQNVHAKYVKNN